MDKLAQVAKEILTPSGHLHVGEPHDPTAEEQGNLSDNEMHKVIFDE